MLELDNSYEGRVNELRIRRQQFEERKISNRDEEARRAERRAEFER